MLSDDKITQWIDQLKGGDAYAAELLWQRYFQQVVSLARRRLEGAKRAVADEEDVALSAFKSFCVGAREGRFPALSDRDSLWSLLVAITANKSVDMIRRENRLKRGGTGGPTAEDAGAAREPRELVSLSQIVNSEPTPEFAAQLSEQFATLLTRLDEAQDPDLAKIVMAKMSGESTPEVAKQLGCTRRTVERKLALVRRIWEQDAN